MIFAVLQPRDEAFQDRCIEIIDVILNHAKKGVSGIYNRNKYDQEKQLWLTKWSQHLSRLLKKKQPAAKGASGRKSIKGSTGEPKK